ncbi:MAG: flagellar type III secretion system pore protein FliP [Bdellovibrionota bacterium]
MDFSNPIGLVVLSGLIALIPLTLALGTSYVKVSVVLGLLKSGLGVQQVPGPIVTMALALSLSVFIMAPVFNKSTESLDVIPKFSTSRLPTKAEIEKLAPVIKPWKEFMFKHCGERELQLFSMFDNKENKQDLPEVKNLNAQTSLRILAPAFLLTELKEAFVMAFILLIPFLVIDLIVANILVGMGMFMVSPVLISLPLKLLLFVISDGWMILIKSLISSYAGG